MNNQIWGALPTAMTDHFNDLATANRIPLDTAQISTTSQFTVLVADKIDPLPQGAIRHSIQARYDADGHLEHCEIRIVHRRDLALQPVLVLSWNPQHMNLPYSTVDDIIAEYLVQNDVEMEVAA